MDELLRILQANALESPENIAKMLNLPVAEVTQRIADYEKRGVIRGYQAILNEDRLDLDKVTAVIDERDLRLIAICRGSHVTRSGGLRQRAAIAAGRCPFHLDTFYAQNLQALRCLDAPAGLG